ncbi:cyclohexanecarboxylate-CoA ligase [Kineobactrum salinum]|uniref:Cyclohexanecarboxylate-CoA ligase n=1 Tax=Kineobactrum salinum TaxID=2708301 RepID=A0A6C0U6X6_9GAMM|nr:cyclohexanecarboxylate-CoA ligase [Kineobactrum salinum]
MRWDAGRAEAAYRDGWWVRETLADSLEREARESPDRILLVDGDIHLCAREAHHRVTHLAQILLDRTPTGSVVSFMLPNWHEAALIYHAITLAGMVAHPILPSLRDQELWFMLSDSRSRLLFIPSAYRGHDYVEMVKRVTGDLPQAPDVIVLRGDAGEYIAYSDLERSTVSGSLPHLDPDAVRLIMYTSGTTGRSKGVLHTHNTLHALLMQIGQHWLVEPGDTFLVPSPISHIGGSIYAFEAPLLLGTAAILMDQWNPEAALFLATTTPCTHICGATPFLQSLLDVAERVDEHLPDLKLFVCGGASVPPSLIKAATAHFSGACVTRVYGSTEVPVTTVGCTGHNELGYAATTDGRSGIAEIRLADGAGDVGEILVRGPQMLVGYLHGEAESEVFDNQGFYRTGDLGRWIDDKYLVVSGRVKDIIIRNGENISPKEIEDLLMEHPQIKEVAIVGLPDARTGERACAVVVVKGGIAPDVNTLAQFLDQRGLAKFKFPEDVVVRNVLPKNEAGKVLKHQLRTDLIQSGETS